MVRVSFEMVRRVDVMSWIDSVHFWDSSGLEQLMNSFVDSSIDVSDSIIRFYHQQNYICIGYLFLFICNFSEFLQNLYFRENFGVLRK